MEKGKERKVSAVGGEMHLKYKGLFCLPQVNIRCRTEMKDNSFGLRETDEEKYNRKKGQKDQRKGIIK